MNSVAWLALISALVLAAVGLWFHFRVLMRRLNSYTSVFVILVAVSGFDE